MLKRISCKFVALIGKLGLSLLIFIVGTASTILFSEFSPPTVSLCRLAQNPFWYNGRTVRIIADGEHAGTFERSIIIEDETCYLPDAWSSVSLAENSEPTAETEKLFTGSDTEIYRARVLLIGRFDANATQDCFGPKFAIKATNVEMMSEITGKPKPKRTE